MNVAPQTCAVLHVIAHMQKGGAERQLCLLVDASRHRHVITVLPGSDRATTAKIVPLPGLNPMAIYRSVRETIRANEIDIVQLWLPDRLTIPAMFAARAEGCRIISGDRRKVRNYGRAAIRDRLNYVNHVFADVVIPNYPHFPPRTSLRRLLGIPRKTQTIPNGLDLAPANRPIGSLPNRLLFVGRLVEQKRVDRLIDVMPQLQAAGIAGLDIVGEGPEGADLKRRADELADPDRVVFHGHMSNWGEVFDPETHVLVLPSASEGMSNTLFEAIAWGFLPMVTGTAELETLLDSWPAKPILIDPDAPQTIVDGARDIQASTAAEIEQRVRQMQTALSRFSVSAMAEEYDRVYDRLCTVGIAAGRQSA
ncbi:glycosyltransferase [Mameliella alba]|nr:glycosyltransferase [Mameliella alba]MBY6168513.1 glycosyltransferase [Mameliella alba]MBY6174266.1 glycosyltransferase [Mameliella alba]